MSQPEPTKFDAQFGYTADGEKVHTSYDAAGLQCTNGPAIVEVITWARADAPSPREAGFAALHAARVSPARICDHCTGPATRAAYAAYSDTHS